MITWPDAEHASTWPDARKAVHIFHHTAIKPHPTSGWRSHDQARTYDDCIIQGPIFVRNMTAKLTWPRKTRFAIQPPQLSPEPEGGPMTRAWLGSMFAALIALSPATAQTPAWQF